MFRNARNTTRTNVVCVEDVHRWCEQQSRQAPGLAAIAAAFQNPMSVVMHNSVRTAPQPPARGKFDDSELVARHASAAAAATARSLPGGGPLALGAQLPSIAFRPGETDIQPFLPRTIPPCGVPAEKVKVRCFGMGFQAARNPDAALEFAVVDDQLDELQGFVCDDYDFARPNGYRKWVQTSWTTGKYQLLQFTGFLFAYMSIRHPRIQHALNAALVIAYVSFMLARGVHQRTVAQHVQAITKVVVYLGSTGQLSPWSQELLPTYLIWLHRVSSQLDASSPPTIPATPEELMEEGRWLPAPQLALIMQRLYDKAMVVAAKQHWSVGDAVFVMHACICCCLFGFIPPLRSSVIQSLLAPGFSGRCPHVNCTYDRCCGNVLRWLDDAKTRLEVVLMHYKTIAFTKKAVRFSFPPDLNALLVAHITKGLPIITRCLGEDECPPYLFLHEPDPRKQLDYGDVHSIFCSNAFPPSSVHAEFGPRVCRRIYITYVMGGQGQPVDCTPSPDGAAWVLTNSVNVWSKVYDTNRNNRLGQEAVDGTPAFRAALVRQALAEQQNQRQQRQQQQWLDAEQEQLGNEAPQPEGQQQHEVSGGHHSNSITQQSGGHQQGQQQRHGQVRAHRDQTLQCMQTQQQRLLPRPSPALQQQQRQQQRACSMLHQPAALGSPAAATAAAVQALMQSTGTRALQQQQQQQRLRQQPRQQQQRRLLPVLPSRQRPSLRQPPIFSQQQLLQQQQRQPSLNRPSRQAAVASVAAGLQALMRGSGQMRLQQQRVPLPLQLPPKQQQGSIGQPPASLGVAAGVAAGLQALMHNTGTAALQQQQQMADSGWLGLNPPEPASMLPTQLLQNQQQQVARSGSAGSALPNPASMLPAQLLQQQVCMRQPPTTVSVAAGVAAGLQALMQRARMPALQQQQLHLAGCGWPRATAAKPAGMLPAQLLQDHQHQVPGSARSSLTPPDPGGMLPSQLLQQRQPQLQLQQQLACSSWMGALPPTAQQQGKRKRLRHAQPELAAVAEAEAAAAAAVIHDVSSSSCGGYFFARRAARVIAGTDNERRQKQEHPRQHAHNEQQQQQQMPQQHISHSVITISSDETSSAGRTLGREQQHHQQQQSISVICISDSDSDSGNDDDGFGVGHEAEVCEQEQEPPAPPPPPQQSCGTLPAESSFYTCSDEFSDAEEDSMCTSKGAPGKVSSC